MSAPDPETEAVDQRRKLWNAERLAQSWAMETGIRREDGLSLLAVLGDVEAVQPGPEAPAVPGVTRQTLCENEWVSLNVVRKPDAGVNGYVYSHETRCQGRIVAVLPYRDTPGGREYLVKSEMTPCWGFGQVLSAITGGYEGGDIEDDAVREMLEETGYAIAADDLIPLGESYASKSADTVYSLFSVNLTGLEPGEAIGDGTRVEAESAAVWLAARKLADIMDPQVAVMYLRMEAVMASFGRLMNRVLARAATYEPADAARPVGAVLERPTIDGEPRGETDPSEDASQGFTTADAASREGSGGSDGEAAEPHMTLLDAAWGVIANAGWDDCAKTPGWQEAAVRWRDDYHRWLDLHLRPGGYRSWEQLAGSLVRERDALFSEVAGLRLERARAGSAALVAADLDLETPAASWRERAVAAEGKLARIAQICRTIGQVSAERIMAIIGTKEGDDYDRDFDGPVL